MGIYDDYLSRLAMAESGGKADAQNPNSSAGGLYQFIDSTWLQHAKPLRPELDDASLLALKKDPTFSKQVAESFTAANDQALQGAGINPTDQYRSLAHFAGPQGAIKLIQADPNASAASVLGDAAVSANPFLKNMTAQQAVEWAQNRLNGKGGVPSGGAPQQSPQGKPEDTSYVNSMLKGGPLALFGYGQRGYDWGNAMLGAAASLAAINSPAQAAVYAGMMKKNNDDWETQVDNQNGRVVRINKKTGEIKYDYDNNFLPAYRARKAIEAGYKAPSNDAVKEFNAHQGYLDQTYGIASDIKDLQEIMDRNPNFGGWLSKAKALGTAAFDGTNMKFSDETRKQLESAGLLSSNEQMDFFNRLERLKSKLVLSEQLKQKGVQTEGDAIRMGQAFFNNMSTMTPDGLKGALDDIRGSALKDYTRVYNNYKGYIDRYGEFDQRFAPAAANYDRFAGYQTLASDAYKQYEEAKKNRQAAPSGTAKPQEQTKKFKWSLE